ncbi:MAG: nucleotidyltransferase domain-containing protein [Methanobrevibacter sp.]|jgi:predicted nucleotidyltransferase|nr:nucleotidyltransferase domain-containing protein [Candidatus Methanovirga meridionalis]
MLKKLFQSKTRIKILSYFSINPDTKVYIREFSRILEENINSVRRELINLENIKILTSQEKGNLKYYGMNKESPIYKEITNIFLKTEGISKSIKKTFKNENIETLFIYGSFASGKAKIHSDLDLFIVGDLDEDHLIEKIDKIEQKFSKEINYTLFNNKEIRNRIKEKDPFLDSILKNPKIFIINNEKEFLKNIKGFDL